MNAQAEIYEGEDMEQGEVIVEMPGDSIGIHFRVDGRLVASAFFDAFQLGVLVGQLSQAGAEEGATA